MQGKIWTQCKRARRPVVVPTVVPAEAEVLVPVIIPMGRRRARQGRGGGQAEFPDALAKL